jgi:hypothetical protein
MSKSDLFPNATSSAFAFSQSLGYYAVDTLSNGNGYWLKYPNSAQINLCGLPVENPIAFVKNGWNLIGGFESDVSVNSITTNPPGIIQSYLFGYYNGYFVADTIRKGKGYWVKVSRDGKIIFNNTLSKVSSEISSLDKVLKNAGEIIITDNKNRMAKLYLSENSSGEFELPPVPPSEIFDVRFASNRFVENVNQENYLLINSADYPVKIKSTKYTLKIESELNQKVDEILEAGNELVIQDANIKLLRLLPVIIPERTELYQNYPNPFNPETRIKFALKNKSKVNLKLFDALGREITTLINEEKEAGIHSYILNANVLNLPSGVYFCQLIAGDYVVIKKMIYLK